MKNYLLLALLLNTFTNTLFFSFLIYQNNFLILELKNSSLELKNSSLELKNIIELYLTPSEKITTITVPSIAPIVNSEIVSVENTSLVSIFSNPIFIGVVSLVITITVVYFFGTYYYSSCPYANEIKSSVPSFTENVVGTANDLSSAARDLASTSAVVAEPINTAATAGTNSIAETISSLDEDITEEVVQTTLSVLIKILIMRFF